MKNKMFRGTLQQDAQEFLRCLLTQIHDEIAITVPACPLDMGGGATWKSHDSSGGGCHRGSTISSASHESDCSNSSGDSSSKLVISARTSPVQSCRKSGSSPKAKTAVSVPSSPANLPKFSLRSSYSKIRGGSLSAKSSTESLEGKKPQSQPPQTSVPPSPALSDHHTPREGRGEEEEEVGSLRLKWSEGDVFVADTITRSVTLHTKGRGPVSVPSCPEGSESETKADKKLDVRELSSTSHDSGAPTPLPGLPVAEGEGQRSKTVADRRRLSASKASSEEGGETVTLRERRQSAQPRTRSIVSEVFEGLLESRVKCLACKKVSVTREPFQDLSLPIPGRKEMAKYSQKEVGGAEAKGEEPSKGSLSQSFCTVWNLVSTLTKDLLVGPPTNLHDCLNAFFDTSELKGDNRYYCSHCKSFQNSQKEMNIVQLPEVLCVHLKRFRFDAYFSSKISRHIAFPMTGLDMAEYLKEGAQCSGGHQYELSAVVTHYGGAGGGHYVTYAKNLSRNSWYEFNDTRVFSVSTETVMAAEGYVLFYRRVPPSDSQASQAFDHCVLLPKPGTRVPSPDVCYISRYWLHLFKYCADPGPIFQYEFACRHGAVSPTKTGDARCKSLLIRKEVWNLLQQRYGGGPMVQQLEVCQSCQAHLVHLNERRGKEKEAIHQIQTEEHQVADKRPTEPYFLSIEWLHQWQKFIHCTTLEVSQPGPIDNSCLLKVDEKSAVSLVDGAAARMLSHTTWTYFMATYGGGPTIVTSQHQTALELAQRE